MEDNSELFYSRLIVQNQHTLSYRLAVPKAQLHTQQHASVRLTTNCACAMMVIMAREDGRHKSMQVEDEKLYMQQIKA